MFELLKKARSKVEAAKILGVKKNYNLPVIRILLPAEESGLGEIYRQSTKTRPYWRRSNRRLQFRRLALCIKAVSGHL